VHVVLVHQRHVEVDHVAHQAHVDAPGGYVGGDQHPYVALLERLHRVDARILALVGVDHANLIFGRFPGRKR
jgi:hypothetical protein